MRHLNGGVAMRKNSALSRAALLAACAFVLPMPAALASHQVCKDVQVKHNGSKDDNRLLGTGAGAVVGGVLGNQIGGGKGRTLATVAGAVGGGYAGKRIQENNQHGTVTSSTVRRCEMVSDGGSQIVGYDVRYEYKGVTRTVRMDHDPGDRVQVQEGVVAVSDAH
jgi:uncharacterized protein YcfJ